MKLKNYISIFFVLFTLFFSSCSEDIDDPIVKVLPEFSIQTKSGSTDVVVGDTLFFSAKDVESPTEVTYSWMLKGEEVSTEEKYKFFDAEIGEYQLILQLTNLDGMATDTVTINVTGKLPIVTVNSDDEDNRILKGKTIHFSASVENADVDDQYSWKVDGQEVASTPEFDFTEAEVGEHEVTLEVTNQYGTTTKTIQAEFYDVDYTRGTFVLNEGNMTTENGSLIYISPEGDVIDSLYFKVNGEHLGNVEQDMFINNGKAYFISQNGGPMLAIADLKTMKKIATYNDFMTYNYMEGYPEQAVNWPSNLAVTDEHHIYMRSNNGITLFNPDPKKITQIPGSERANKNKMLVSHGKVFAGAGSKLLVIEGENVVKTINMGGTVRGMSKFDADNIYVACSTSPGSIAKINTVNLSISKTNEIDEASFGRSFEAASSSISAKGDTIYFSKGMVIKRHIFSTGETKDMANVKEEIENAGIMYNCLAVHPVTGHVFFNTIKQFGWDFLINDITEFDCSGAKGNLVNDFKNHTHFPAGIIFPESYE